MKVRRENLKEVLVGKEEQVERKKHWARAGVPGWSKWESGPSVIGDALAWRSGVC